MRDSYDRPGDPCSWAASYSARSVLRCWRRRSASSMSPPASLRHSSASSRSRSTRWPSQSSTRVRARNFLLPAGVLDLPQLGHVVRSAHEACSVGSGFRRLHFRLSRTRPPCRTSAPGRSHPSRPAMASSRSVTRLHTLDGVTSQIGPPRAKISAASSWSRSAGHWSPPPSSADTPGRTSISATRTISANAKSPAWECPGRRGHNATTSVCCGLQRGEHQLRAVHHVDVRRVLSGLTSAC